jgi:hypothetical protein
MSEIRSENIAPRNLQRMSPPQFLTAIYLSILLLSVQMLPSLLRYLNLDSSMVVGTTAAALMILAIFVVTPLILNRYFHRHERVQLGPFVASTAVTLLVIPHAAIADAFQSVNLKRLLETLPVLFLVISGGLALGRIMVKRPDREVRWAIGCSFVILSAAVLLRLCGLQPRETADALEKQVFPFTENSHFALAFMPVVFYQCINSSGRRRSGILLMGFIVGLLLQSFTLLIGCVLAAIACRRIFILTLAALVLAVGVVPYEYQYFTDRLAITGTGDNISSLVYIQGWQLILEALTRSHGWGVGFQQLGIHGTDVSAANAIVTAAGTDGSNVLDGGFVFSKLAAEFGIFGIVTGMVFAVASLRALWALRRQQARPIVTFARCVLVSYTVDMFARGTSYFSGSTLLAIAAIGILVNNRQHLSLLARQRLHTDPTLA